MNKLKLNLFNTSIFYNYRFTVWPEDALEKVAEYYLKDMSINSDIASSCVVICKEFHTTARDASAR